MLTCCGLQTAWARRLGHAAWDNTKELYLYIFLHNTATLCFHFEYERFFLETPFLNVHNGDKFPRRLGCSTVTIPLKLSLKVL